MPKKQLAEKLNVAVEVTLDGKTWPLIVTNRIIMEIEDENPGMNLISGQVASLLRPNMRLLNTVLHALLLRAGAKYTFDEVVDLVHPGNMLKLTTAILTAWGNSMPPKPTPEEEAAAAGGPTTAEAQ